MLLSMSRRQGRVCQCPRLLHIMKDIFSRIVREKRFPNRFGRFEEAEILKLLDGILKLLDGILKRFHGVLKHFLIVY
jgi:hypothetical protein